MAEKRVNTAVIVEKTPTEIAPANAPRVRLLIYNNSDQTVFIGDAEVTVENGYPIPAGGTFAETTASGGPMDLAFAQAWYAVAAVDGAEVRVLEG